MQKVSIHRVTWADIRPGDFVVWTNPCSTYGGTVESVEHGVDMVRVTWVGGGHNYQDSNAPVLILRTPSC